MTSAGRLARALAAVLAIGVAAPGATQLRDGEPTRASGPVTITVHSALRGVSGDAGRFTTAGAVIDHGAEQGVFEETAGGFVVRTTLTGQRGALVVEEQLLSDGSAVLGTWTVLSGTGIYRDARGGGMSALTATGTGSRRVLTGAL